MSARYRVLTVPENDPQRGPCDLCIVDGLSLRAYGAQLRAWRAAVAPLFFPVLFLTTRQHASNAMREAWQIVDEVLVRPVERFELAARIDALLRTRRLSQRLAETEDRFAHERRIAARLQEAALPSQLPEIPGFVFDAFYRAGRADARIGGDWYDVLRLQDGRLVVSVGDVSGSGLEAAVTMANIRQVIRGVANVQPDPALILDAASRTLSAEDPERLVTAFVATIDPVTTELVYASAGHPPAYIVTRTGIRRLGSIGVPLGFPLRHVRHSTRARFPFDAMLVLYTDGLIEATRDVVDGEARLERVLAEDNFVHTPSAAHRLHERVLDRDPHDDIAILTITRGDREVPGIDRWAFASEDQTTARAMRDAFSRRLRESGYTPDAVVAAEIVLSELLGNVVRYAPGPVYVALDTTTSAAVLHVIDSGTGFRYAPKLPADIFAERGRGLFIVRGMTEDFTVTPNAGGGSHARAVLENAPVFPGYGWEMNDDNATITSDLGTGDDDLDRDAMGIGVGESDDFDNATPDVAETDERLRGAS